MNITTRFIVVCERAFTAAGTNNLNLINIFTQINAATFPFTHPQFALVVNFDITEAGSHILHVRILGPDGNQVAQSELPVNIVAGPPSPDGFGRASNWQVIANYEHFAFGAPGTYTFALTLDDTPLGERALQVVPVAGQRQPGIA